jgi:hypothetical protein
MKGRDTMESNLDAIALFAVVGVSMATSLMLIVRLLAKEFGEGSREGG